MRGEGLCWYEGRTPQDRMDRTRLANAQQEACRGAHTPRSLGQRAGIPSQSARLVLEDLVNRGELVELLPGLYGRGARDLVTPWVIGGVVAVAGLALLLAVLP